MLVAEVGELHASRQPAEDPAGNTWAWGRCGANDELACVLRRRSGRLVSRQVFGLALWVFGELLPDGRDGLLVVGNWYGGIDAEGRPRERFAEPEPYLAWLFPSGVLRCILELGSPGNELLLPAAALDRSGAAWVAGTFDRTIVVGGQNLTTRGKRDIFLVKVAAPGSSGK